ncbi:MAG: hypothetical protein WB770_08670 [Acidimicrobiales bacterium]
MNILVCLKRVPDVGGRITLTADAKDIDAKFLGFTISPHEECAIEEAVRVVESHGGAVTALTLGSEAAIEQLRNAIALGAHQAALLETDGREFGPIATAKAIAAFARDRGPFELVMFGNESADAGNFQVGIRVAHLLGLPVVTGLKALEIQGDRIRARREYAGNGEIFQVSLPAVLTVKEGINLPRYPSLPGRMRATKATIDKVPVEWEEEGLRSEALRVPRQDRRSAEVLGNGVDAIAKLVVLLEEIGIIS